MDANFSHSNIKQLSVVSPFFTGRHDQSVSSLSQKPTYLQAFDLKLSSSPEVLEFTGLEKISIVSLEIVHVIPIREIFRKT